MKLLLLLTIMITSLLQAKISKGDNLNISIKGVPTDEQTTINGTYPVSSSGKIHLPYVSPISASGLSADALARRVEAAYKNAQIYTTPNISITSLKDVESERKKIEEGNQKFVTVSGQVGRSGPQAYRPGLRLIDVVSAAAPNEFAAQNRVELLRNGKTYKYDMKIPAHTVVKVYPNDQIKLNQKKWNGK